MAISNQSLLDYWEKNPDALAKAAQTNPTAFAPKLTLGSPEGNPGYSVGAQRYTPQHVKFNADGTKTITGGERIEGTQGITWVGAPGGDTQENRDAFSNWYASQSPYVKDGTNLRWATADKTGAAIPPPGSVQPSGGLLQTQPVGEPTRMQTAPTAPPVAPQRTQPHSAESLKAYFEANPEAMTGEKLTSWINSSPENANNFGSGLKTYYKDQLDAARAGELSPQQSVELFQQAPQWEGYGRTGLATIANNFYNTVKSNPELYNTLPFEQQAQYHWLEFQKGDISGNQKDDRIKAARKAAGLPPDQTEGDKRYIARNKVTKEGKKDGIDPSDVYNIGTYTQKDTGKDDGLLQQFINKSIPGADLTDVLDFGGAPLQMAAYVAAPFTGGASAAAYNTLAAAEGRMDWKDAAINTVAASAPVIANAQTLVSPIYANAALAGAVEAARGGDIKDILTASGINLGVNVGTNLMVDTITGNPTASTWAQVVPEDVANSLGVYTDVGAGAFRDFFSGAGATLDSIDSFLSGESGITLSESGNIRTDLKVPEWFSGTYNQLSEGGKKLLGLQMQSGGR